jgi:hypothetical protein
MEPVNCLWWWSYSWNWKMMTEKALETDFQLHAQSNNCGIQIHQWEWDWKIHEDKSPRFNYSPIILMPRERLQIWKHLNAWRFKAAEFQIRNIWLNFRRITKEASDSFQFKLTHSQPGTKISNLWRNWKWLVRLYKKKEKIKIKQTSMNHLFFSFHLLNFVGLPLLFLIGLPHTFLGVYWGWILYSSSTIKALWSI